MKKLVVVIALFVYGMGFSQNNTVTGSILDGEFNNEPLAFAKITVKSTNQVTQTDRQGNFVLHIKPGTYTLIYEFIGYEAIELNNIVIKEETENLQDVVLNAKKIVFESGIASKG